MNKIVQLILALSILLFNSCSEAVVNEQWDDNNIAEEISPELIEESDVSDESIDKIGPHNKGNKVIFDALPRIEDNFQNKEMRLAEEGPKLMWNDYELLRPGGDFTYYALARMEVSTGNAIILKIESYAPQMIDSFREKVLYFLIVFEENWEVSDRKRIHEYNSMKEGVLTTSGSNEMDGINVTWENLALVAGKVEVIKDETETFEFSETGAKAAEEFQRNLHRLTLKIDPILY
ncbi:MAG: hypothetical protein ACI837_003250 [Crocinitomicaceae bacterium]|jgi:hypothetical protein